MLIDEAIKHAEEVVEEKRYEYQECLAVHDMEEATNCAKCAEEHRQLAEWLKDYKRLIEQQPCEDCISRQVVLDCLTATGLKKFDFILDTRDKIKNLPPVTPQPKIGKWLAKSFHEVYCDNCGFDFDIMTNEFMDKMKYCPNCGARMVEPQESEG